MTISELIKELEILKELHGDVYVEQGSGTLVATCEPLRRLNDEGEVVAVCVK